MLATEKMDCLGFRALRATMFSDLWNPVYLAIKDVKAKSVMVQSQFPCFSQLKIISTEVEPSVCPSVFYLWAYDDGIRHRLYAEFRSA